MATYLPTPSTFDGAFGDSYDNLLPTSQLAQAEPSFYEPSQMQGGQSTDVFFWNTNAQYCGDTNTYALSSLCPSQLDFGTYHQVSSFAEVQLDSFFGPELYAAPNIAVPNAAISQTIDPIDQASEYFQSLPVDELERVLYYLSEFSLQPASFTADASAASNPQSSSPISAVASPIAPLFAFTPPVTPSYAEAPLSSPSPLDAHPRHDVVVCEWDSCGALLPPQKDGKAEKVITAHFREAHGFLSTTPGKHVCRWADCNTAACGRSLRKHIAAHCRASAACPDCGDVFARTDSVIRHRAANVCSKCTMCNTRFDSVAERRAHVVMGMCEGKRPGRPQTVLRGQRRPSPY